MKSSFSYVILYDMEDEWLLAGQGDRPLRLTRMRSGARRRETVSPVWTVQEVCRRLKKSRRQVYRYIRAGRLKPAARILGQWIFGPEEVGGSASRPLPGFLRRLFWDIRLADLSADHHRDLILSRVLEWGDRSAVEWALKVYPKRAWADFLRGRGAAVLSRPAWHFWVSQLGVKRAGGTASHWRRRGRHWGGIP